MISIITTRLLEKVSYSNALFFSFLTALIKRKTRVKQKTFFPQHQETGILFALSLACLIQVRCSWQGTQVLVGLSTNISMGLCTMACVFPLQMRCTNPLSKQRRMLFQSSEEARKRISQPFLMPDQRTIIERIPRATIKIIGIPRDH